MTCHDTVISKIPRIASLAKSQAQSPTVGGSLRLTIRFIFPCLGYQSDLRKGILIMSKCCGGINSDIILWCKYTIDSIFKIKNQLTLSAGSYIVYQFICDKFGEKCKGKAIRAWKSKGTFLIPKQKPLKNELLMPTTCNL